MEKRFEFLPDVAIADIAFRARGADIGELFENCALALTDVMADPKKISLKEKKKFSVEGTTQEELLFNFLGELVYIKDVDNLIFGKFKVGVSEQKLEAECSGSSLGEIGRANLRNDVKAITMHMFSVKKIAKGYEATVVVDI